MNEARRENAEKNKGTDKEDNVKHKTRKKKTEEQLIQNEHHSLTWDTCEELAEHGKVAWRSEVTAESAALPSGVLPAQHLLLGQEEALSSHTSEGHRAGRVGGSCRSPHGWTWEGKRRKRKKTGEESKCFGHGPILTLTVLLTSRVLLSVLFTLHGKEASLSYQKLSMEILSTQPLRKKTPNHQTCVYSDLPVLSYSPHL